MSKKTEEAVEEAIRAHVADEMPGALVTAWYLSLAIKTEEDFEQNMTKYPSMGPHGQSHHVAVGLMQTVLNGLNKLESR